MKKDLIIKVLLIMMITIPLFLLFNLNLKNNFKEHISTNFILFSVIEIINIIIFLISINNKTITNKFLIIIICYLLLSAVIPVFYTVRISSPTGPRSELIGPGVERTYRDIYGIDITCLVNLVK